MGIVNVVPYSGRSLYNAGFEKLYEAKSPQRCLIFKHKRVVR